MKEIKAIFHVGVGGQKGWVFDISGTCPCLPASQYKDATKILVRRKNEKVFSSKYSSESKDTQV